ncbi:MAG: hypothetical protein J0I07_22370, partial [Myxococcales bacterium]|nr:hypothetical protein [Myxococcales bacterium]
MSTRARLRRVCRRAEGKRGGVRGVAPQDLGDHARGPVGVIGGDRGGHLDDLVEPLQVVEGNREPELAAVLVIR